MSDTPDRKKSLREQVEEYKRRQQEMADSKSDPDPDLDPDPDADADADPDPDPDPDSDSESDSESEDADVDAEMDFTPEEKARIDALTADGSKVVRIVSGVFLAVGLVLLVTAAVIYAFTQRSLAAQIQTEGLVVSNVVRTHTSRPQNSSRDVTSDYYHAVVEFALADGTKKTVEMAEGNWPKAYEEGQKVTVRYDPARPLGARIGGGGPMDYFAPLLVGFLGAVFTALAIGVRRAFS